MLVCGRKVEQVDFSRVVSKRDKKRGLFVQLP